eukprot:gene8548-10149_t
MLRAMIELTAPAEQLNLFYLHLTIKLIVFNNAKGPKIRGEDLKNWPISIAISKDAGVTWPYVRDLEPDFDPMLEYSYPSIQQGVSPYI